MINKKRIPLEQFTVEISNPVTRLTVMQATVYEDGQFALNGKLASCIYGRKLRIAFTPDGEHLILQESENNDPISFPKNGRKTLTDASVLLKSRGILFPARYDIQYYPDDGIWQGDHVANPTKSPSGKPRKAKKN